MASPFLLLALLGTANFCPTRALAQPVSEEFPDVQWALLKYQGQGAESWNPRPQALARLAWEIRKRTSIAIQLETPAVDPSRDELFSYPLLAWLGDRAFPPLPEVAIVNLRQHLAEGGTILIDISDGVAGGGFDTSVRRELKRIFPDQAPARVPPEHVLYKSFYLIDRHGGRVQTKAYLEGLWVEQRLAVVISSNDMAGAMARDEFGQWTYDVGPGGESAREWAFRLGINLLMYALCLDYKEDQVHIPYILQRRR